MFLDQTNPSITHATVLTVTTGATSYNSGMKGLGFLKNIRSVSRKRHKIGRKQFDDVFICFVTNRSVTNGLTDGQSGVNNELCCKNHGCSLFSHSNAVGLQSATGQKHSNYMGCRRGGNP